jgi:hypothetical protein
MRAGFQAHLTKPYQIGQLVAIINRLVPAPGSADVALGKPAARTSDTARQGA